MSIETFRAHCRLQLETPEALDIPWGLRPRCDLPFSSWAEFERHVKEAHPKHFQENRARHRTKPPIRPTKTRLGRPAVAYDRQTVTPGTWFTYHGFRCQVVGHVSRDRIRFLLHVPHGEPGPTDNRTAEVVGSTEDYVLWTATAPAAHVADAVAASS